MLGGWTARSQSDRSVRDGVYTDAQAGRGQDVFGRICSRCHNITDFTSDTFLASWEASTVLDLFTLMQKSMPQDNPGSLEPQEYADVIAFVLRSNQLPAGTTELDTEADHLKAIRIEKKK
jgi:mono/diheme cytochrome c family protein